MNKIVLGFLLCAGFSTLATSALADPTAADRNYGYAFGDDLLQGGMTDSTTAMIKVRAKPRREVLIRPRVQFVSEMLKSVENM